MTTLRRPSLSPWPPLRPRNGGACFLCRKRDDGLAAVGADRTNTMQAVWACHEHIHLAKKAIDMDPHLYDAIEREALADGGADAGEYLDSVGQTDVARLTADQWNTFCAKLVDGFSASVHRRLQSEECPF